MVTIASQTGHRCSGQRPSTGTRGRKGLVWAALAGAALLWCRPAVAQQSSNGDGDPATVPAAEAAYRRGDIRIDGRLEEEAWQDATPVTEFVQGEPVENAPAEQPTEVRVLYDEGALYVSARMYDWQLTRSAPSSCVAMIRASTTTSSSHSTPTRTAEPGIASG